MLGKLQPGVDHRQAENELNILMQRLVEQFPDAHKGPNMISSDPLWRSPFGVNVYLYGTLPILFALALVLLLLACANLANLLLVRSVARRREFAIRLSIGATRWRLVLQLMVENALIALAGGGLALLLTKWTAHGLSAFLPPTSLPLTLDGRVDRTVLVATIMISLLTAAVSGVLPALRASRLALAPLSALKDEALSTSGGTTRASSGSTCSASSSPESILAGPKRAQYPDATPRGAFPDAHKGPNTISSDPLWRSPFGVNVYLYGTLPILFALALVLLLLACANLANLLLLRSVARRREFAIRLSIGATRWRLVLQLMVENALIALAGAGLALLLTKWTAHGLSAFLPPTTLPLTLNGRVDRTVLVAAIMISLLTAAVSGVLPALRASRLALAPVSALKDEALNTSGGIHKSRLAGGLVVGQIALSMLLLVCAGLLVRSLQRAQESHPGFDPSHVFLASFDLKPTGYSRAQGIEFDKQMLVRLKSLPGVQSVTLGDFSPLSYTIHTDFIQPEGYVPGKNESMEVDRGVAGPEYLRTVRTALLAGRDFTDRDNASAPPVSIINKALADRYWQGQDPIGKRLQVARQWTTVVGVAANGKYRRLVYDTAPLVLIPMLQSYRTDQIVYVRVAGDPMAYASAVERTVHGLNSDLPLFNETTLAANMRMGNAFERIAAAFAGSFGLLALILAAIGVYGVVAYATKQRTHEIGIRMALGAGKRDIFRQVLGRGLHFAGLGLVLGLMISFALTRYLRGMLYGVGTADWLTFVMVAILLCVATLIACFVPARRAASIDPMQALRTE